MKLILPIVALLPFVVGCTQEKSNGDVFDGREKEELDYQYFKDNLIEWENLFFQAKSQYFVYIYSLSCGHCERIKDDVLNCFYNYSDWFYLMEWNDGIPIISNVDLTIGSTSIDTVGILGTPTLLGISKEKLSLNIAGEKDVLEFIEHLPHNF